MLRNLRLKMRHSKPDQLSSVLKATIWCTWLLRLWGLAVEIWFLATKCTATRIVEPTFLPLKAFSDARNKTVIGISARIVVSKTVFLPQILGVHSPKQQGISVLWITHCPTKTRLSKDRQHRESKTANRCSATWIAERLSTLKQVTSAAIASAVTLMCVLPVGCPILDTFILPRNITISYAQLKSGSYSLI